MNVVHLGKIEIVITTLLAIEAGNQDHDHVLLMIGGDQSLALAVEGDQGQIPIVEGRDLNQILVLHCHHALAQVLATGLAQDQGRDQDRAHIPSVVVTNRDRHLAHALDPDHVRILLDESVDQDLAHLDVEGIG